MEGVAVVVRVCDGVRDGVAPGVPGALAVPVQLAVMLGEGEADEVTDCVPLPVPDEVRLAEPLAVIEPLAVMLGVAVSVVVLETDAPSDGEEDGDTGDAVAVVLPLAVMLAVREAEGEVEADRDAVTLAEALSEAEALPDRVIVALGEVDGVADGGSGDGVMVGVG